MGRRPDGELEHEVMEVLWGAPDSLTPSEVRAALGDSLAYTSIATVLTRLWGKGLVHRHADGRRFAYSPALTRDEWRSSRMAAVLAETTDRSTLLASFIGRLSRRDRAELRRLLGERSS